MTTYNLLLIDNLTELARQVGKYNDDVTTIIYRVGKQSHTVTIPLTEIHTRTLEFGDSRPRTSLSFIHRLNGRILFTSFDVPIQAITAKSIKYHRNMNTIFQPSHSGHSGYTRIGPIVRQWLDNIQEATLGNCEQIQARNKAIKEDLVAAVWHPRRVERWLEQGVELEDL